jgi:hypothetical protein
VALPTHVSHVRRPTRGVAQIKRLRLVRPPVVAAKDYCIADVGDRPWGWQVRGCRVSLLDLC